MLQGFFLVDRNFDRGRRGLRGVFPRSARTGGQGAGTSSWVGAGDFPRALIRLFGTGLSGWGLLRRARWAWWIGLVFAAFWLAADALPVLVIERGDVYWLRPGGFQTFLVVSLLCLGLAVALLLSPSARAVFRRPAA
jgi:hypothetical protein